MLEGDHFGLKLAAEEEAKENSSKKEEGLSADAMLT
jgi:hypothetical protein